MLRHPDAFTSEEIARLHGVVNKLFRIAHDAPPATFLVSQSDLGLLRVCTHNGTPLIRRGTFMGTNIESRQFVPLDVIYATY